jgi:hypothetical protein
MPMQWLVLANLVLASLMLGLVLFVQVVHYPLMRDVGRETWQGYHAQHVRRTTWIVAPAMLLEVVAAALWVATQTDAWSVAAATLLAGAWAVTFLGAVPAHHQLAQRFEASLHARLLAFNAIRSALWAGRVGVLWIAAA